ncbi:EIICB-Glc [Trueperella bialowiezensis]|uniref:EIICB-Glc n=1 Tax=Trueperella bialowiezensis TaxID=312285 RepID=A0A3S4X4V0_9ACTO|nr:EIICB-Glc [Trueperella bialowiezensis]
MDIGGLLAALGGAENIRSVEGALSRIRVGLHDKNLVDGEALRELGVIGVVLQHDAVQVILGAGAEQTAVELAKCVSQLPS